MTEAEAVELGPDVEATTNDLTGWLSAKSYGETVAWSKVIVDKASDRIVGAHLVGHNSEELVQLFSFAMTHDISVSKIKATQFAFPTVSSDVKNMFWKQIRA